MNDLYSSYNREKFYKTSHQIKELLRALQHADDLREIKYLRYSLHLAIDAIAEIKCSDINEMDEHKKYMEHIYELCGKDDLYGEET